MIERHTPTLSVIIPTHNAEKEMRQLLEILIEQTYPIQELIVVDSASTDNTKSICREFNKVRLIEIEKKKFDHGKTRDIAFRMSIGDVVVFLTQDALPANKCFLEKLVAPLADQSIAVSTGRQLPKPDANKAEKLVRLFNYPAESYIRSRDDLSTMGIKTYFCSDVCAAYNREIYLKLGGFDYPILTNEDMFFAAKAINAGYRISYTADAIVYHSHNFTFREQYERNFIQGYEIERHIGEFNNVKQESEGIRMVKFVSKELLKQGHIGSFIHFGVDCCVRLMGSRAGRRKARSEV